jgi:restriction endonuclease Mrr
MEAQVPVPGGEKLRLPLLKALSDGASHLIDDVAPAVAQQLGMSADEVSTAGPNARNTMLEYRLRWARTALNKAGLVTLPGELLLQITDAGRDVLEQGLSELDNATLQQLSPAFVQWQIEMGNVNVEPTLRSSDTVVWVVRAGQGGSDAGKFLEHEIVSMG